MLNSMHSGRQFCLRKSLRSLSIANINLIFTFFITFLKETLLSNLWDCIDLAASFILHFFIQEIRYLYFKPYLSSLYLILFYFFLDYRQSFCRRYSKIVSKVTIQRISFCHPQNMPSFLFLNLIYSISNLYYH